MAGVDVGDLDGDLGVTGADASSSRTLTWAIGLHRDRRHCGRTPVLLAQRLGLGRHAWRWGIVRGGEADHDLAAAVGRARMCRTAATAATISGGARPRGSAGLRARILASRLPDPGVTGR
jgi:hypothetical protein